MEETKKVADTVQEKAAPVKSKEDLQAEELLRRVRSKIELEG